MLKIQLGKEKLRELDLKICRLLSFVSLPTR